MKGFYVKFFFFAFLLLIPIFSIYRSFQITNRNHLIEKENLLVLPGKSDCDSIAKIVFDSDAENRRGAFRIEQAISLMKIKLPGQQAWKNVQIGQYLVDQSLLEIEGEKYQYLEKPSKYQWETFCNQPIENFGIENSPTPFSISFIPKRREDRIVLPKETVESLLKPQLNPDQSSLNEFQSELKDWLQLQQTRQPFPQNKIQAILVENLLRQLPVSTGQAWQNADSPEAKRKVLEECITQFIIGKRSEIEKELIFFLPISLQSMLKKDSPEPQEIRFFRKWVRTHLHGKTGVYVRTLKIDDMFRIFKMLDSLSGAPVAQWVLYDHIRSPLLSRLSIPISEDLIKIRKWLSAKKALNDLNNASRKEQLKQVVERVISNFSHSDFQQFPKTLRNKARDYLVRKALKTGKIAYFLPPREYGVFLSSIPEGWRIKSLVPGLLKVERRTENNERIIIEAPLNTPMILENGDWLHVGDFVFSFELQPRVTTEQRQLTKAECFSLGLKETNIKYKLQDKQQYHLYLVLRSLEKVHNPDRIISGFLKKIRTDQISVIQDQIDNEERSWILSCSLENRLVTQKALYSFWKPSGYIPDSYTIPQYSRLLQKLQEEGLVLNFQGFFHMASPDLLLKSKHDLNSPKPKANTSDPSFLLYQTFWLKKFENATAEERDRWKVLLERARRTPAVLQAIQKANLSFRPAGFLFKAKIGDVSITSDPTWQWQDNNTWQPAVFRRDLCPPQLHSFVDDWIWDTHPWQPYKKKKIQRTFKKEFDLSHDATLLSCEMSVVTCGEVAIFLNGKLIKLTTDDGPEMIVRRWEVKDLNSVASALNRKGTNTLIISFRNIPPRRTLANRVGLQVALTPDVTQQIPFIQTDSSWQSAMSYYFNWQTSHQSAKWRNVITQADYLASSIIPYVPVIWCNEPLEWSLYKPRIVKRYFKKEFEWPGGDGFIRVASPDYYEAFLNGRKLNAAQEWTKINAGFFRTGKKNILSIEVANRFDPPLDIGKNSTLFVDQQTGRLCLRSNGFRYNNPYNMKHSKTLARGKIIDRDAYSLPKLRLIDGEDKILKAADELPLARSVNQKTLYVKDILFPPESVEDVKLAKLPCQGRGYLEIKWLGQKRKINLARHGNGRMPDGNWYYFYSVANTFPYSQKPWWKPENPADFVDSPPIKQNITNLPCSHDFDFDRAQIMLHSSLRNGIRIFDRTLSYTHFKPADPVSDHSEISQDGANPGFKLGEILVFDQSGQEYHALEIDGYPGLVFRPVNERPYVFQVPAVRFERYDDGTIRLYQIGPWPAKKLTINGCEVPAEGSRLKDRDIITMAGYTFQFHNNDHGILAGNVNINGIPERYYPPGLGLSHTVGVNFDFHRNGLERVMNPVLTGKWKQDQHGQPPNVRLTLDDDLCRIVKDEINRQLAIIDRRYAYRKWELENSLKKATTLQKEFCSDQIRQIKENRQRFGMLVILDEDGEIIAASSEPSPEALPAEIRTTLRNAAGAPISNQLINHSLHDASIRPGSSFKLVTAMAGFEFGKGKFSEAGRLLQEGWFFNNTKNLNQVTLKNRNVIVDLSNHRQHKMTRGTDLTDALRRSYNVWFAYLGLLLNHNSLNSDVYQPGDIYRAYVNREQRAENFPLLAQATRVGFNQKMSLYHLRCLANSSDKKLDHYLHRNPDAVDDPLTMAVCQFPAQVFDQRSIARMAIGQHTVTETPLLNALIALTLSNKWNGKQPSPRIIRSIEFNGGTRLAKDEGPEITATCSESTARKIRQAMLSVVRDGTAQLAFKSSPLKNRIFGKTGTSERGISGLFDNSWWTCFVEAPNGKTYAIAACFPDAGEGAHHAADCVKRLLDRLYRYYGWGQ